MWDLTKINEKDFKTLNFNKKCDPFDKKKSLITLFNNKNKEK